jgi:ABC-type Fe3+-citrate transport system substrate-binding protein
MPDQFPHEEKNKNEETQFELELLQQIDPDYMKKLRKKQEREKAKSRSDSLKKMLASLEDALL